MHAVLFTCRKVKNKDTFRFDLWPKALARSERKVLERAREDYHFERNMREWAKQEARYERNALERASAEEE
jgi:hypothetical protein